MMQHEMNRLMKINKYPKIKLTATEEKDNWEMQEAGHERKCSHNEAKRTSIYLLLSSLGTQNTRLTFCFKLTKKLPSWTQRSLFVKTIQTAAK